MDNTEQDRGAGSCDAKNVTIRVTFGMTILFVCALMMIVYLFLYLMVHFTRTPKYQKKDLYQEEVYAPKEDYSQKVDPRLMYPSHSAISGLYRSAEDVARVLARIAPNRDKALEIIVSQLKRYCSNPDRYMDMTIVAWIQMPPPYETLVSATVLSAYSFCKDGGVNNEAIGYLKDERYIMYAGYTGTSEPISRVPYNRWEMDIVLALNPYSNPDTLEFSRNILRPK